MIDPKPITISEREFYHALLRMLRKHGGIDPHKERAVALRVLRKHGIQPTDFALQELRKGAAVLLRRLIDYATQDTNTTEGTPNGAHNRP